MHARLLLRDLALLRFPAGFFSSSCLSMNTEESTYGKRSSRGRTAQILLLVLQSRVNEVHETLRPPLRLFAMFVVRLLPALALQIIH